MKNIVTILKKELKRFFTDYRMILTLVSPGIIIFVLYSLMGTFLTNMMDPSDQPTYQIVIVNEPRSPNNHIEDYLDLSKLDIKYDLKNATIDKVDEYLLLIENEQLDLLVVFDEDFYNKAMDYDPTNPTTDGPPNVYLYYNNTKNESSQISSIYFGLINDFGNEISTKFKVSNLDQSTSDQTAIMLITTLVPFLLIIFLFSGAMSVSIESIAGEKERGTIATVLATPIRRSELVLGKVFALSIASLLGATSSFVGLMLSLPKLMGFDGDFNIFGMYGIGTFIILFLVVATTTILFVVLISMISTFSKSVKEASAMSSILMILNMVISVTSMGGEATTNSVSYLIPIYNSLQSITSILSMDIIMINLLITVISNFVYITLGVFILSKMFNSEKIMFNK